MTTTRSRAAALCLGLALASCGSDGGGSSGGGVAVVPAPSPSPTVAASSLSVSLTPMQSNLRGYDDNSDVALTIEATRAGTTTDAVIPDVQYDRTKLSIPDGIEAGSDGRYTIRAHTARGLALGRYSGELTFRLCRDAGCASVYPGTTQTASYTLDVSMREWSMFQRNPAHTGYVHASFSPAAFRRAWEWAPAAYRLSPASSHDGMAMVTAYNRDGTTSVHALDIATGAQRWGYNLGQVHFASGPAIGNGRVFLTTMTVSSDENRIVTLDAATGEFRSPVMLFSAQWSFFLPPTPFDTSLYMSAGYQGNTVYGFDIAAQTQWSVAGEGAGIWDGETPAVDDRYAYYYAGKAMVLIDRRTGQVKEAMADPFFQGSGSSYYGAPILAPSSGLVLAYAGTRGSASSSPLAAWAPGSGLRWRSADAYVTTPAVTNGMIYLARNQPSRLDALREASGAPVWSWTPPADERFIGNTIATDTLVFVSTDKAVYAIAIDDPAHPVAWSAPTPGAMAITADGTLLVTQEMPLEYSSSTMPQKLVAYRLR
ncbi:PQQ-binding-like beta-propeller repeat protein [Sphingomonas sp. KR1UV-12]|uniref:PQQ-binding-like beta-propeller repeat protein n=1 Tax=Sphingomonas aurea TaxID=3063994 RepID=A0ABT9EK70_9SPHN|nr:PQQ-binding-like beta-propeller repeat protein [Sphingomonas sp. KR1UV-12]MDP1027369.1 PQQ-binding-like beta-propeller repeat protein [Sphingomonas sp. KR1UV-12]